MAINLNARRPEVREALDALAQLPDEHIMGSLIGPDGKPGKDVTVADLRRGLLDGTTDLTPAQITVSANRRRILLDVAERDGRTVDELLAMIDQMRSRA